MKSPDERARQSCRILVDAAQAEADEGHGFVVPASVVRSLRVIPQHACTILTFSLHEAARLLNIPPAILDAEVHHHLVVHDIVHGATRPGARPATRPGGTTGTAGQPLTRSGPR